MSNACSYRYHVVDVFTDRPLEGNSLAVFPDATGGPYPGSDGRENHDLAANASY
jgi:predicted PhzF superfamily epimerase YddE/YHI9